MTKRDLVEITLDELTKQWNGSYASREQFDLIYVSSGSGFDAVIKWDPKKLSKGAEEAQSHIPKAIQITLKKSGFWNGYFHCTIFDLAETGLLTRSQKEKSIDTDNISWMPFRSVHKKFRSLEEEIIRYKKMKENNSFLEDLIKVFPRTLDGAILGEDYDD